eukprot:7776371-Pyramimonas_sp.AAC.1
MITVCSPPANCTLPGRRRLVAIAASFVRCSSNVSPCSSGGTAVSRLHLSMASLFSGHSLRSLPSQAGHGGSFPPLRPP